MTENDDGAPAGESSPPTPKKVKLPSDDELKEPVKDEVHSEEESKQIEDDDEDGSPPGWQQQSPPLLDMIHLPIPSPLPPTPPLPSSNADLDMEQEESEDEGPPPGWDSKYQLQEQEEQLVTPTAVLAISSDIKMEDIQRNSQTEEGPAPKLVPSDIQVEEQDSEDEGPPPGWDYKCQSQTERNLQTACPTIPRIDIKLEDVQQDVCNEEGSLPQPHSSPKQDLVSSDIKVEEEDSEDEGPPPGWDTKILPEPDLHMPSPTTTKSDMKREDLQENAPNGDGSELQSPAHPDAAPELVPSELICENPDIKVEQQDLEDEGPPPGWDFKCQCEPELQTAQPTTPQLDSKIEDDQQDDEGPPPGWDSTPQGHSSLPRPNVQSGNGFEQKNDNDVKESPQPPSKLKSFPPTSPQMAKPPTTENNPEMGQMVCGSCRRLLSYPRGARYVECACCLEENYVLEEHEVGQVICGGCDVLLMYPYGSQKVRCANCCCETDIVDQNRRPPLSEQQRARRHLKRVQTG